MIPWGLISKNIKLLLFIVAGAAVMFFYNKYTVAVEKAGRLEKNASNDRKLDSVGFAEKDFSVEDLKEDIIYTDPELLKELKQNKIELRNIRKLIKTQNQYINTDTTTYILHQILKGIQENKAAKQKVIDSTDCHIVEAYIHFNGKDLALDVTKVGFTTKTDIVAHAEKVGLRFWKWFRKRKITVTTLDKCGNSTTELVNVVKR